MTDQTEGRPMPQFSIVTAVEELKPALCRVFLMNVLMGVLTIEEAQRRLYEHHKGVLAQRGWFLDGEES